MKQKFTSCGHHLDSGVGCPNPANSVVGYEAVYHPEFVGQTHDCCGEHPRIPLSRKKIKAGFYSLVTPDGTVVATMSKATEASRDYPWDWLLTPGLVWGRGPMLPVGAPTYEAAVNLAECEYQIRTLHARFGVMEAGK